MTPFFFSGPSPLNRLVARKERGVVGRVRYFHARVHGRLWYTMLWVAATMVGIALLWNAQYEYLGIGDPVSSYAPVQDILARALSLLGEEEFWRHWMASRASIYGGVLIGGGLGFLWGLLSPFRILMKATLLGILFLTFGVPKPIFIPIATAWFGYEGWGAPFFLASLASFIIMGVMTYHAIGLVPLDQMEAAEIDGANRWQILWHIALPEARPTIMLGVGLAVASASPAVIAAEMMYRNVGLGALEHLMLSRGDVAGAYAIVPLYALENGLVYGLFRGLWLWHSWHSEPELFSSLLRRVRRRLRRPG